MNDDDQEARDLKVMADHVARLEEHFDTVQIFCSRGSDDGGTITCQLGGGNWFARYGQIRQWIVKQEEEFRQEVTREKRCESLLAHQQAQRHESRRRRYRGHG